MAATFFGKGGTVETWVLGRRGLEFWVVVIYTLIDNKKYLGCQNNGSGHMVHWKENYGGDQGRDTYFFAKPTQPSSPEEEGEETEIEPFL